MQVRTFFWYDRIISRNKMLIRKAFKQNPYHYFIHGNAGDIFTRDLIQSYYKLDCCNVRETGSRLLIIGSIGHCIMPGDVICGIGIKDNSIPKPSEHDCNIFGLRGPISYEAFKKAGYDVSQVKFLMDPGLLIRYFISYDSIHPVKNRVGFIPHYRERGLYVKEIPAGLTFIDIDNSPAEVARQILECELVYTSSLHGLIFSHALNRPAVFVRPQTNEPLLKYKDYFASINKPMEKPLDSIFDAQFIKSPVSPTDFNFKKEDFFFPGSDFLIEKNIIKNNLSEQSLPRTE